jgi:hypothetical protein
VLGIIPKRQIGAKKLHQSESTRQCPVLRLVLGEHAALGKKLGGGDATINYRTVRCAPDYPGRQPRAGPAVGRAVSVGHVNQANGHQVAPDYPVCQVAEGWQRSDP